MSEQTFTPEITVDQAFKMHAGARRVFARFDKYASRFLAFIHFASTVIWLK